MKHKAKASTVSFNTLKKAIVKDEQTRGAFILGRMMADVGMWLRSAREVAGLTQEDIAKRAKVDQSDVARLEKGGGRRGPTLGTLVTRAESQGYVLVMQLVPAKKGKGKDESPLKLIPVAGSRTHA